MEPDALAAARRHAERHRISLGEAVTDLVRRAIEQPLSTDTRNGLQVVRLGPRSPRVTAALVDKLRDDLP